MVAHGAMKCSVLAPINVYRHNDHNDYYSICFLCSRRGAPYSVQQRDFRPWLVAAWRAMSVSVLHDMCLFKPKFHYADFPVTSAASPRQTRDVPFSPNSITPTSSKLPLTGTFRGSRRDGIWAKWDVTGLWRTSWGLGKSV